MWLQGRRAKFQGCISTSIRGSRAPVCGSRERGRGSRAAFLPAKSFPGHQCVAPGREGAVTGHQCVAPGKQGEVPGLYFCQQVSRAPVLWLVSPGHAACIAKSCRLSAVCIVKATRLSVEVGLNIKIRHFYFPRLYIAMSMNHLYG